MFDFPTTPATGTVVTVPDGSYRVWDSQKWRAAPSGASIYPPVSGYLPLIGGTLTGNLTINKTTTYAGTTASLSDAALNIAQTSSGNITGTGEVDHNSLVITDTLSVNPPANTIASFQAQIDGTTLSLNSLASPPVAVSFTGSISGSTLTILSGIPGLAPGSTVQWAGGTDMVKIAAGPGLWTLYNTHGTVSSQAMTGLLNTFSVMASISGSTLTVTSAYGPGAITAGMQVQWNLPTPGATTIITGPAGGPYTLVNPSGTIPLQPMLLLGPQPAQTVTWDSGDPDNPGTATVGSYITGHPAQFSLLTNQGTVSSRPMQTVKAIQNRNVFGFSSYLNFGGGDGSRYGWRLNISQTAAMAGHAYYLPAYIVNNLRYPSGGTDLWAGAKGAGWVGNTVMNFIKPTTTAVGDPGPINYRGGSSWEFDYQCLAGSPDDPAWPKASTASLGGIAVIRGGQSTWETPMWEADYAIAIAQAGPSVRDASNNIVPAKAAKYGIRFNGLSGVPALDRLHGRAIAAVYPPGAFATDGSLGLYPNVAPFGVDWLSMDYTRAAYRWRGGAVLGSATPLPGALAIGGGYLSATNTTVSLDTAGSVCTGATVAPGQGGANCYLGMVCQDDVSGTQVVVTGVDGAVSPRIGAATTVVLIPRTGQSHNAELPINPVQFRPMGNPITFLAPGPTGPKLNLTWTAPTTLALQPSGGTTVFGGPVTAPVIATGGTASRTLADRFGQIIDIRDLGAACDGTTDDTAAWTAAFAKPDGTVIRIPQNCVTIVGDGNFRANGSRAISVIGDGRGSVIRLKSGTALANDMFTWVGGSTRNVRVENLTIDFNNCPQPTALRSIIVLAQVTGAVVRNVAIINGSANLYMVALNGSSDFIVDSCYFQLTIASSAVQNKGIATLSSLAACYRGRIVNNVCINTNTNFTGGNQMYIAGNDISGWGVGAGIATDPNATRNIIIGNKCHDSATAVDMFGINPNGIENWSAQTLIANNECWNCYGDGIATGGANSLIVGNICWDNNTAGIATGGGIAATASGPSFASGSSFMANHCYDSGANTQSYGFVINNAGITNLTLNANRFTGTVADVFHLTTATFLNNTDYVPRILSADPTVALGAATKQYVDGRGAGNHLLYQSSTLVGNGADLTQDVLQTFTVPANTLLNVGDRLIIRASGTFISSTDSKTAALQWGGGNLLVLNVTTASQQVWRVEAEIMKTGANAQTSSVCFVTNSNTTTATVTTTTRTDTAGIVINVTGQNATNSVASSVTCRYFTVDYVAAA